MHTNGYDDDLFGKMNVSFKPLNLHLSGLQPNLSSLQIDSSETSVLEPETSVECGIRVLLVDNDKESLISIARMLAHNSYQVTMVVSGSIAMKTISAGKKQFDMVIVDVDLPDMDSFQLCKEIEKSGILVVVTSTKDDPKLTYKALANGAFLLVKKPVDELSIKYLHQFLIKQRILRSRKELDGETGYVENLLSDDIFLTESTNEYATRKKRKYHRKNGTKDGGNNHTDQANLLCDQQNLNVEPCSVDIYNKKKMCVEWTKELHQKFMDAVSQLGEGNCYPKEILELMKVSGLTRMQVASHLQKCRHDNWRSPTDRKKQSRKRKFSAPTTVAERDHEKIRVFGSMPHLDFKSQAKVQKNPHLVSIPPFGHKPAEKFQILGSGNSTSMNFNTSTTYFPEKENAPEKWMEHVDPIEGSSLMWAAQGVRFLNPISHPWTLPPSTFNIVPSIVSNENTISKSYSSIHVADNGVAPTKEAINANINFIPPLKISDVMTSELFTENEEMNFLLPEYPNFALENKFENYEFHPREEVNFPQRIENRANEAIGHPENATMTTTSARRLMKEF